MRIVHFFNIIIGGIRKNIFKTVNFRSNIDNLSSEIKNNQFVNKIINFICTDKKRPISVPEDIK